MTLKVGEKQEKGLGAAGTILTVGGNANKYFHDGIQGTDIADFATNTAVDIGAVAGLAVTGVLNWKVGNPPKSTIDHAKDGFKAVIHGIGDAFNSMTKWRFW